MYGSGLVDAGKFKAITRTSIHIRTGRFGKACIVCPPQKMCLKGKWPTISSSARTATANSSTGFPASLSKDQLFTCSRHPIFFVASNVRINGDTGRNYGFTYIHVGVNVK